MPQCSVSSFHSLKFLEAQVSKPSRNHTQRGQLLPLLAIGIFALIGMVALSIDVGYWRYQQRVQQSATDSAAIAAAIESDYSTSGTAIMTAGQNDAATNGFRGNLVSAPDPQVTVLINYPPASPDPYYTAGPDPTTKKYVAVEAVITKTQPVFFAGIFGGGATTVSTRAVAVAQGLDGRCIYALNTIPPGTKPPGGSSTGITLNGNGGISAPNCGVITDSVFVQSGTGVVDAQSIGFYDPTGTKIAKCSSSPCPVYPQGQPQSSSYVGDPCASTSNSCGVFASSLPGILPTTPGLVTIDSSGTVHLGPGSYPAGISIGAGASVPTSIPNSPPAVVFDGGGIYNIGSPGVTIGGNITVSQAPSTAASGNTPAFDSGLVFYNQGNLFTVSGKSSFTFTGPTTGSYPGMVYYQPPISSNPLSCPTGTNADVLTLNGGANNTDALAGITYAPCASVTLNGNSPGVQAMIVNDLTLNGGALTVNPGSNLAVGGRRHFVLGE